MITPCGEPTAFSHGVLLQAEASAKPTFRAFDPVLDAVWLKALWVRTMPLRWDISGESLKTVLSDTKLILVAEHNGRPVGLGAVDYDLSGEAGLVFLAVDSAWQGQGIGTKLLQALERDLKALQIHVLRLGAVSTATYLWPGMPAEMDVAWPYFERRGWSAEEGCADLVQKLGGFVTPAWLTDGMADAGITLRLSNSELRASVAAFEAEKFPAWSSYFRQDQPAEDEDKRVLVAQDAFGRIVGTLLLDANVPRRWCVDENVQVGSINVLGVAPNKRQLGIGLALAAKAMEVLQERGCIKCYIQWTGLVDWYGKLGTSVWADYRMAKKPL